jgi:hypothetical protein
VNLQLRVIHKLERQVAVVSFVEEVLELLEKESSPVIHLDCNENMRKMDEKREEMRSRCVQLMTSAVFW